MPKPLNLTGHKYGKLTAVAITDKRSGTSYKWNCVCDCGNTCCVASNNLRTGHVDSCGCDTPYKRSLSSSITHGMSNSVEYKAWFHLKERCFNPESKSYLLYGGRGITLQESWVNNFSSFIAYLGRRPTKLHTVERIDNDLDYCAGNIRWATKSEQAHNKGMYKSNNTGMTGVNLTNKRTPSGADCWCYIATWYLPDGKQTNKVFSISKHGLLPAFAKACQHRQKELDRLKAEEGYSDKHGEQRKSK